MSSRNIRIVASFATLPLLWIGACRTASPDPEVADADPEAGGIVATTEGAGFAGVWSTTYGAMRLVQTGTRVAGRYSYLDGASLEGDVEGNLLRARYSEPDGVEGRAVFVLSDDGNSFHGVWRPDSIAGADADLELSSPEVGAWTGARLLPVPGRTWLVILEAHWEQSLGEHEYSYGAMLRSFFERLPAVEVRHRFFHDRADLVRFCRDLGDLVEPVIVYISTHGTPEGIAAGRELIDGEVIGEALRDAGEIRLVHLGGCALLAGGLGAELRTAAAPHAAFPISGFRQNVDWAASAIVDFTYLDLVLEHGMPPADAVRSVRAMLSFAGQGGREEDAFPGTDLTLVP